MLEYSAERTLPQHEAQRLEDRLIYLKQVALYNHAQSYCADSVVLDLGCGEGYGAAILSSCARLVVAADNSIEAVNYAAQKYTIRNIAFVLCDAQHLPFRENAFGAVTSFEVIEHVADVPEFLRQVRRVCAHTVLFSTPNRLLRLLPFQKPWNTFHRREYDYRGFSRALRPVFARISLLCVTASPDVLEIEKRRVKQNPFLAYPRMLAKMLMPASLYQRAKAFRPAPASISSYDVGTTRVTEADYYLSSTALRTGITLVAICE